MRTTYQCVELAGVEGLLLLGDGLGVELGEGVGCAAEGGVERAVGLVQARRHLRLALPRHRRLAAAAKQEPRLGWEAGAAGVGPLFTARCRPGAGKELTGSYRV